MRLVLTRDLFSGEATLGTLSIVYAGSDEVKPFGFSCEDTDRGLDQVDPAGCIAGKVAGLTAIPVGSYRVALTWSPKYVRKVPEVLAVPAFRGIRIHSGNDADDTEGCILPGLDLDAAWWRVLRSRLAAAWLDREIAACEERGELVTLEIRRDPTAWRAWVGRSV